MLFRSVKNVAIPNGPKLTGLILNKNETPFAPLYFDRYEAIKKVEIPNAAHLTGMVLNKMETPFAPLFFDRYEAIRTSK